MKNANKFQFSLSCSLPTKAKNMCGSLRIIVINNSKQFLYHYFLEINNLCREFHWEKIIEFDFSSFWWIESFLFRSTAISSSLAMLYSIQVAEDKEIRNKFIEISFQQKFFFYSPCSGGKGQGWKIKILFNSFQNYLHEKKLQVFKLKHFYVGKLKLFL